MIATRNKPTQPGHYFHCADGLDEVWKIARVMLRNDGLHVYVGNGPIYKLDEYKSGWWGPEPIEFPTFPSPGARRPPL